MVMCKIKRVILVILCLAMIVTTLAGCQTGYYTARQPKMSETDIWISEDPAGYFIWDNEYVGHMGEILLDGELYPFEILFDQGTGSELYKRDGLETTPDRTKLLSADCKFSPDKLVLKIDKFDGFLYSDYYDKIIFERHDFDPKTDELPVLVEGE